MLLLYEEGMVSKRKYTNIRNSSDVMKQSPDQSGKITIYAKLRNSQDPSVQNSDELYQEH